MPVPPRPRSLCSPLERKAASASAPAIIDVHPAAEVTGQLTDAQVGFIADQLRAGCEALGVGGEVRVRIIADAEMSQAHRQFSRIDGPTDVLTFDLSGGASADTRELDCDLLLCIDEAARQAGPRGHTVERELLLYALHGVLHCLGEDDHTDAGYDRMHAAEDALLERLGVGPIFGRPAAEGGAS